MSFESPLTHARERGISMIEVLVTVVILAVGLLGIATLQLQSKRSNFEAAERTAATLLANDILERMRYNARALKTYAGSLESPVAPWGGDSLTGPEPTPDCKTSYCNPEQLAVHDIWEWEKLIDGITETQGTSKAGGLVLPTACLYTSVPEGLVDRSGRYMVAIAWRGSTEISDPQNPDAAANPDPYACGRDTGPLGAGKYDGANGKNTHRRVLVVDTYIRMN